MINRLLQLMQLIVCVTPFTLRLSSHSRFQGFAPLWYDIMHE